MISIVAGCLVASVAGCGVIGRSRVPVPAESINNFNSMMIVPASAKTELTGFAVLEAEVRSLNVIPPDGDKTIIHYKEIEDTTDRYKYKSSGRVKVVLPRSEPEELNSTLVLNVNKHNFPMQIFGEAYASFILNSKTLDEITLSIGLHPISFRDGEPHILPAQCHRRTIATNQLMNVKIKYRTLLHQEAIMNNKLTLALCMSNVSSSNTEPIDCHVMNIAISSSHATVLKRIPWNPLSETSQVVKCIQNLETQRNEENFQYLYRRFFNYALQLPSKFKRVQINCESIPNYVPSNPSIIKYKDKIVRLIRLINYTMDERGNTTMSEPIPNSLHAIKVDDEWIILSYDKTCPIGKARRRDVTYLGIEDGRLTFDSTGNKLLLMGSTTEFSKTGKHCMSISEIDIENKIITPVKLFKMIYNVEKNHAPIIGTNYTVHSWFPLSIYDITTSDADKLDMSYIIPKEDLPIIFSTMRGSSCGIPYPPDSTGDEVKEYWFLVHWSQERTFLDEARFYSHGFVRLDAKTFKPLGYTLPFVFDHIGIEFSCGMIFIENGTKILISYSLNDRNPTDIQVPVDWILKSEASMIFEEAKETLSATEKSLPLVHQASLGKQEIGDPLLIEQ